MLQERISQCTSWLFCNFFVLLVSIFCPSYTHVGANVAIRLPPPSPISSLIGIRLPQQAPSQSSTITVLPPLISNDQSSTTPRSTNLATGVIDIKPLPFGYGATDLNDEEEDDNSSSSSSNSNIDNNNNNNDSGEENNSNDMHGKSGFGGARYYRGSRHDRNREKYKKQKSNSKTGHSATSDTGGSLKIDQGALHEHKQRETGHVDHDSHSNQDKFVKMIWDKGDGFVKRWHWDRGQKLKEAHAESEKKHLEHQDKAHSNELIERQKGEIAKKLANQGSKSNHLLDALDRQRSQAEGQLVNGFVHHEMNMHLKGPKKDHSIHGSLKRVRGNDNNNDDAGEDDGEEDEDRRSRKYKRYRNSKRSNPAIFKVEEEDESEAEEDEDQSKDTHRRRKPSKSYRHNQIASKFRRFPEGKLNEARKFFRGRNMIDSVTQTPEKETETNVLEIEEKNGDDGNEQNDDDNSSDKTKVRKMKNSEEDEHPEEEGEEEEEKEDEGEREDAEGGGSDGSKTGKKKMKKERDYQRKITIKEERTELKAHERLEDPKESKNEDEDHPQSKEEDDEEDEEKPRKKKVYYKGSRGSGFIKQIRATSNGRDPSKKFDPIIRGEVPIEEVEEESSESRTIRGDQARKATNNNVDRNREEIKPLVRGDNINEIKIIKTAATNNQARKNESPSSNSSEESSQPHHSPIVLSPKPVNLISHLINPR
ncbi:uncharacterized protein LOC141852699 [Brevipalpus obovatus]|uniref:uncharacterized protein LOC141852699 n=1 Tax=Brevipalpus obovatus TaxID=246614 RepID=UPI003D9F0CCF